MWQGDAAPVLSEVEWAEASNLTNISSARQSDSRSPDRSVASPGDQCSPPDGLPARRVLVPPKIWKAVVQGHVRRYLLRLMPKPISRSKTRKAVAKRFKITGRGKILRAQSSRRHLLSAKNAKRRRQLGKAARVDKTDEARVRANLPFG
jgi:large subunit ribosomal protein L35